MIFYFSGTGNSQLVARQVGETIGDDIISINQCLKEGTKHVFRSDRPLVFVAPVYAWRMPKVVEHWIREAQFEGNKNAYFILTCAGKSCNASVYAEKLCVEKGFQFNGFGEVIMPSNYLALFPTESQSESQSILERAKPTIDGLAAQIQKGVQISMPSAGIAGKLLSGPINVLYYPLLVHDKGFHVTGGCTSCGKCADRCPLNNIIMEKGEPVWRGNCTHCMACIAGCPTEVIEYKSASKGRPRYYIMEDK